MINEANEPSSACRLWRIYQVETSTPPQAERLYCRLECGEGQGIEQGRLNAEWVSQPAIDGLARSLPLTRSSRASGFVQIPFATSQGAQVPLWGNALSRKAAECVRLRHTSTRQGVRS
jgi:hypothetical protein